MHSDSVDSSRQKVASEKRLWKNFAAKTAPWSFTKRRIGFWRRYQMCRLLTATDL